MNYFAYGSNLDEAQMRTRCPTARAGLVAVLKDHALVFTGHSRRWGGAVATVVPRERASVSGLLWDVSAEDIVALDRFEGHPSVYRRVQRVVIDVDGGEQSSQVYVVPVSRLRLGPPAPAYLALLRSAYQRLGFDESALAEGQVPP